MTGSLFTTNGHRLDGTINQVMAALKWTADGLQPLLAERWEMLDGGKSWMIYLRKNVKWHDGDPFDADDVVFTFNAYANPKVASTWASKVSGIQGYDEFQKGTATSLAGVKRIDSHTVRIDLKTAQPLWMQLDQIFIVILPEHILGKAKPEELRGHPYWLNRVGTGPFKWKEYKPDQWLEVVRNDDYFLGAPKLDRIIYQFYADIPTILNALEKGEVDDMCFEGGGIPYTEVARFVKNPNLVTLPNFDAGLPTYLQLDLNRPYFADVRVRQAMMYAIDRKTLVKTVLAGNPRLANTLYPQTWAVASDLEPYDFNPAKARELLAAAGWDKNRKIDFIYYYQDQISKDMIVAIQQYLADVGINIVPRYADPAQINTMYADKSFEMGYFAQGMGLDPALGTNLFQCGAQLALGYCNPKVDELATLGLSSADRNVRAKYYQEISRILNKELPKIWLFWEVRPLAFNKRIVGLSEHWLQQPLVIFNLPVYQEIEKWYVK
jgi:peptide/nickel transport system substrate-binding protein